MIVEFFGLPGAGKSTLAAALVTALRTSGDPASSPSSMVGSDVSAPLRYVRKSTRIGSSVVRRPAASFRLLRSIAESEQESKTQVGKRWGDFMLAQAFLSQQPSGGSVVLDQGFMQAVWSIGLRGRLESPLQTLSGTTDAWSRPDRVIVVEAPLDQLAKRLRARASRHSRVQDSGRSTVAELDRARDLMSHLLAEARSLGLEPESIITIENPDSASPEDLVSSISPLLGRGSRGR